MFLKGKPSLQKKCFANGHCPFEGVAGGRPLYIWFGPLLHQVIVLNKLIDSSLTITRAQPGNETVFLKPSSKFRLYSREEAILGGEQARDPNLLPPCSPLETYRLKRFRPHWSSSWSHSARQQFQQNDTRQHIHNLHRLMENHNFLQCVLLAMVYVLELLPSGP